MITLLSVSSSNSSSTANAVVNGDFVNNVFAVLDMSSRVFFRTNWGGGGGQTNVSRIRGGREVGVVSN